MLQPDQETIAAFLQRNSTELHAVLNDDAAITVELDEPPTWPVLDAVHVPNAYFLAVDPDGAVDGFTPNTVVFVVRYALDADYDDALATAFTDAYALPGWSTLREDRSPHQGFASAVIAGKYSLPDLELYAENRYVLAEHDGWTYLIQATFTTTADDVAPDEAIVDTLRIEFA